MARNQTVNRVALNIFALNRLRKDCYYEPIRVDFSAIEKPNHQLQAIIPQYNNDGLFYTPSFILPKQKISTEESLQNERSKFSARISHYERQIQEKTPQFKATDNRYCHLCQQEFHQYLEHINSKYHKRMINTSKFNKDINSLCEMFSKLQQHNSESKTQPIGKRKAISKNKSKTKTQSKKITTKQSQKKNKQSLQTMDDNMSINSIPNNLSPEEQKKLQESLKITLQVANYSTNLLSSNTFKQIFKLP